MSSVKFCVIGTGRAGLVHMKGLVNRTRRGDLVAICDADRDVLDKVGDEYGIGVRYPDYREAVADPNVEAVIIVTPCYLHREVACAAAEQGKHILLEKPMAMNVAECETINAAAEQNGVKLQMGFMRRFDEGFLRAKEIVDSGELGRVMKVNSTGRGPGLPPPWIYDLSKSNGILAEVNSHDFDSVRWFSGSEIVRIYAEGANFKCPDAKQDFPDFYDNAIVNLRFANGTLGVIDGTCPCHYGYDARVEILCEMGVIFVGSSIKEGVTRVKVDDAQVTGVGTGYSDTVWSWRTLFRDAYVAEVEHFAECIREDKQPSVTGYDGLKAVEAVCAANQSILSGKPVELPGKTE